MLLADAGEPGSWCRVFNNPDHGLRFQEPTVVGVDYPTLGISAARNDQKSGDLNIQTYAATPSKRGSVSSFRVTQLPSAGDVSVFCDDVAYPNWRTVGDGEIEIDRSVGEQTFRIATRSSQRRKGLETGRGSALAAAGSSEAESGAVGARDKRRYKPAAASCKAPCY